MKKLPASQLAVFAALAAFSAVLQLIHIGYQSPQWGMWLDLVAVSWLIAFFLFGRKASFYVSLLGALIITLFSPDTWLGASMKWLATAPMWLILSLYQPTAYQSLKKLILPLVLALIIRSLIIIPINYYYAIPIWTGMPPSVAIKVIPWYIIAGFNTLQGIIDVSLAWLIVFKFRLSRYSHLSTKS